MYAAATTGNASIDLLLPFLNLGVVIVLLIMFVRRVGVVPAWVLIDQKESSARELAAKDAIIAGLAQDKAHLSAVSEALQTAFRDQVIPALTRSNQLSADYVDLLRRQAGAVG